MHRYILPILITSAFVSVPLFANAQSCTDPGTYQGQPCSVEGSVGTCVSVRGLNIFNCQTSNTGTQPIGGTLQSPGGNTSGANFPSPGGNTGTKLLNPLQGGTNVESFLISILAFIVRIGAIVVVLMLVYVGYLFVVAQGSDSKISEARNALLWTVVGALVLLGSQAIAYGIKATVQALSVGS